MLYTRTSNPIPETNNGYGERSHAPSGEMIQPLPQLQKGCLVL
jgi:hypothetical protein